MINLKDKIRTPRTSDPKTTDTWYHCYCDSCGQDRGYLCRIYASRLCRSCSGKRSHNNMSLETRQKMSKAKKGGTPWNKGQLGVSPETRRKMQDAKIGYIPHNKGKTMSLEQRIKLSCSVRKIDRGAFDKFQSTDSKRGRDLIQKLNLCEQCFKRDNYTCDIYQISGGTLNAHHKNSWTHFPKQKYDLKNLVCLSYDAHRVFHALYGNGKAALITEDQYEEFKKSIQDRMRFKQDLYLVAGVSASGKSWVSGQLQDKFNYVSYDHTPRYHHLYELLMHNDKPLLFDMSIGVSTFVKRCSHLFNIHLILIQESTEVIGARLLGRDDCMTHAVSRQVGQMKALIPRAEFVGTSLGVLRYLRDL